MTVAKKIGAKQLKKMHLIKMKAAKKNLNQTVYDKKKCALKMIVAKKIGAKQFKKMHLIKMKAAKKI